MDWLSARLKAVPFHGNARAFPAHAAYISAAVEAYGFQPHEPQPNVTPLGAREGRIPGLDQLLHHKRGTRGGAVSTSCGLIHSLHGFPVKAVVYDCDTVAAGCSRERARPTGGFSHNDTDRRS